MRMAHYASARFLPLARRGFDCQPPAQRQLQRRHLPSIRLVIVSQQVQDAMENQPADFDSRRMTFRPGVAPRRGGGYHHVTQEALELRAGRGPCPALRALGPGKRKHVRRPRLAAKGGIQSSDFAVIDNGNVEFSFPQSQKPAEAAGKGARRRQIHRHSFLAVQDQGASGRHKSRAAAQEFFRLASAAFAWSNSS